jgi:hypothetical protein
MPEHRTQFVHAGVHREKTKAKGGTPSRVSPIRFGREAARVTLLIICAAATWFMAGLGWIVQVVHYPLFETVGEGNFTEYHRRHSERITPIVLPAMSIELITAGWLLFSRPTGTSMALVIVGFALAASTWLATAVLAVPRHAELGSGFDARAHRRLVRSSWLRTAAWSAHGVVVAVLLAQAS